MNQVLTEKCDKCYVATSENVYSLVAFRVEDFCHILFVKLDTFLLKRQRHHSLLFLHRQSSRKPGNPTQPAPYTWMAVRQRKKSNKRQMMEGTDGNADRHTSSSNLPSRHGNQSDGTKQVWYRGTTLVSQVVFYVKVGLLLLVVLAGVLLIIARVDSSDNSGSADATTPSSAAPSTPKEAPQTTPTAPTAPTTAVYTQRGSFRVEAEYPHDPQAFCQGLEVKNDTHLYESIGLYQQSAMRIVELRTGNVQQETSMEDELFGEGATLIQSPEPLLVQLTWKEKTALVYHPESLAEIERFPYQTTNGQGWGIAYDTHRPGIVYVTDGTEFVHTWELERDVTGSLSYQETSKVPVTFQFPESPDGPVTLKRINELEYDPHTRTLLANVWYQDVLVRIDIDTGFVTKVYDLTSLYKDRAPGADVFNGIAVIPDKPGQFYATGKLWPVLFHLTLLE